MKLRLIETTFFQTKSLCEQLSQSKFSLCSTSLKLLNQLIPTLNSKFNSLKSLIGHTRPKRGLFNGIGSLFKLAFGTLDYDDAVQYEKAINALDSDEKKTLNLLSEQTLVVKSTITNFNNTLTNLNKNEATFNKKLNLIQTFVKTTEAKLFDLTLKQNIDEHFSLLTLMTRQRICRFNHSITGS